ncbi:hypothetical protein ScPMuIL_000503 [Solemya velum]
MFAKHYARLCGDVALKNYRYLSTSEAATALRPFYFLVHPDLFGQHPKERLINEESLKKLNQYITLLQRSRSVKPLDVTFYLRHKGVQHKKGLASVDLSLSSTNLRTVVSSILRSCDLPLDFVETVPVKPAVSLRPIKWDLGNELDNRESEWTIIKKKEKKTLWVWLKENISRAKKQEAETQLTILDIKALSQEIQQKVELMDLRWESDWGQPYFMSCLKSFNRFFMEHPDRLKSLLRGRVLVFGDTKGVSLLGDIVLSRADVPTDWVKLLMLVPAYDAVLERVPYMEKKLSELLNDIHVTQRKRRQSVMAEDYEMLLNTLLNSLRRSQTDVRKYFGYKKLKDLQLVVEEGSGPFALSRSGQFLIPATVPGYMVVKFIAESQDKAKEMLKNAQVELDKETEAMFQCKRRLGLGLLMKDESVTPSQMTECCFRLMTEKEIGPMLKGMRLEIANYYTVMQDGRIAIPWNWGSQT